jgi:hypothetical protein
VGMITEIERRELGQASGVVDFERSFYATDQIQELKIEDGHLWIRVKGG